MYREDVKLIVRAISGYYPNFHPDNVSETIDLWAIALADYDFELVKKALVAYASSDTSGFAPSVGQLLGVIKGAAKTEIGESEAWDMVYKAICNSTYNAQSEYDKLPPKVQKAVGGARALYAMATEEHFNATVESSNFKRAYQNVCERDKVKDAISPVLLQEIKKMAIEQENNLLTIEEKKDGN